MTRPKTSTVIKIAALVFYFLLAFFLAKGQVVSNFSADPDGWGTIVVSSGIPAVIANYNGVGGNPGGDISVDLTNPTTPFYFYADRYFDAPLKFLGNKSFSYNQNLTFDLQQSLAGTDVAAAEVVISGGGVTIYFPVSSFPSTTSWTSYSVLLKETAGWKTGGLGGAATTMNEMKLVLSNIASLRIRAQYFPSFPVGSYSCKLDNVVLNVLPLVQPPTITSISPQSAVVGTTVTITGTNFNPTASQNNIYFNGVKAAPSSATATQLVVTVPVSAARGQLVVENLGTGLQASSTQSFNSLFDNNKDFGGQIIPASMAPGYKAILPMSNSGNTFSSMDKGDFDGDGRVDLVTSETQSTTIYIYKNLGVTGSVSPSSFSAGNILAGLSLIPGGSPNLGPLTVADVDNDGKPDIAAVTSSGGGQGYLAVFQNTSTAGSISFANPKFFAYPYYSSQLYMTSGDIDGDGRVDFLYTTGTSPGGIWVNQNMSTPGNIDFAYGIAIGTSGSHTDILVGDLNADGKPEVIGGGGSAVEIYKNVSSPGTITLNAPFTVTTTSGSYFAVADLDADNKSDLIWSAYGVQYIYLARNNYAGTTFDATSFGSPIAISSQLGNPDGLDVSDINSDGKPDIVIVGSSDVGIMENVGVAGALSASSFLSPVLFQGSATGQFLYGLGPVIADVDADNKPEVIFVYSNNAVPTGEKGVYIFRNESFPSPRIDTTTPSSGVVGTSVNFVGDHLSSGPGFPPVVGRLGKIATAILPSSNTSASGVVTPSISGRFSFTEHGLTAYSKPFSVLFNTTQIINSSSFGPSVDFALAINPRDALDVADFDDDGKADVAVIENGFTAKIFKNTHAIPGQSITTASLAVQATTYSSGYNLIALDIDGDGKTDLNSGGGLLQNTSSGSISFTSVTSTTGGFTTSSSADFNKDGKTDLAFTNGSLNVQVFENLSRNGAFTPNGTFQNFGGGAINLAAPGVPYSVVASDFDGDGYDDIISANAITNNATFFLNNKTYGKLTTSSFSFLGNYGTTGLQPYDITANDFDGDGKTDIGITYYNSAFVSVLLNNSVLGDISFTGTDIPVATKGYKITSQDLDGDGKAEIVIIHQPNPGPGSFTVLQNKCTPGAVSFTTTNFPIARNPQAVNIADINGDRKPDILIVANGGAVNALMVFENKIAFTPPYNNKIFYNRADGTIWATNGDGSADQFIVNGFWPRLSPDGRYLLYHKGAAVSNLSVTSYVMDLVLGVETLVFTSTDYTVSNSWSQDASKIFFDYSCDIRTMNRDGTGVAVIDNGGGCYDDAPDTRQSDGLIAFHNQFSGILTMNSDGSNRTPVPNTTGLDYYARWSPDGQWISFTRTSVTPYVLYKIKPDGSNLTALTNLAAGETFGGILGSVGVWMNDGSAIIINGKIDCQSGIFKVAADGSKVIQRLAMTFPTSNPDEVGSIIGTPPLAFSPLYTDPIISSFSPLVGAVGNTVTLTGANFDPTPANNIVKFNGTVATVTASTPTSITTTVPAGATTGNITVLTVCNPGTSSSPFTVGVSASITITTQPASVYSVCDGAAPVISTGATGTTNITYQWQIFNSGSGSYVDLTNTGGYSNVSTTSITINSTGNFGAGTYRCKIDGDFAPTVYSNTVSFTVNALPPTPIAANGSNCGPGSVVLTASGGSNGNYFWYDQNGLIPGQSNSTYTTPVIASTSFYAVAVTDGTCVSTKTNITAAILTVPIGPITSNITNCGPGSVTFTASGATNGNYLWYDINGLINGQVNNTYTTPAISATTIYSVAITNGSCTSTQTNVTATINTIPTAPTTLGATECTGSTFTLSASGGTNGQYAWYVSPSGGSAIAGEVNSTYVTPALTANTTYYVSINDGTCESARSPVIATVNTSGCSIPVIATTTLVTQVGGTVTLALVPLITTANNNLDVSSIVVTKQPSSGAIASVVNGVLTINYNGVTFSGSEQLTIRACDTDGNCASQVFTIDVAGDIIVYNGISPNGKNPAFIIEYISLLPETKYNTVHIFDRWENLVWHGNNYDNSSVVFTGVSDGGSDLPSGVYFYKINFSSGRKTETGFISLRRQ